MHALRKSYFSLGLLLAGTASAVPVDYVREVKPLLTESCSPCHGASQQKGGLRLDTAANARKGGDAGPTFTPGKSAGSLLIQAVRGTHADIARMPYKKPPLASAQITLLTQWIDQGGKAPKDEVPGVPKIHWSFSPPQRAIEPSVKQNGWVRNPIDSFILARLEKEKIKPAPEADRTTLIRRLSLDLVGLPPTIPEMDAFVTDRSPDAYAQLVERLLASPHYGERWGRHWLDVARYADSNGYSIDAPRTIWKYRDWVIDALNRDLPFDQFAIQQLAGDMLPNATLAQKTATGFHRNTQLNQEGGIDKEQFRLESIIDRVNTTGTAFLGLTIGCCQCHDHKFDPLTQKEFYRLFAFFNNADEPELPLASSEDVALAKDIEAQVAAYLAALPIQEPGIYERMVTWERSLTTAQRFAQSQAVREAFDVQFPERNEEKRQTVLAAYVESDAENLAHQTAIKKLRAAKPTVLTTLVMRELPQPRRTYLFIKGDFTRDGGPVSPGVPAILPPLNVNGIPTRLDLAKWVVDPCNPLTARVAVNRVWQQYFGRGIVETENDFGTQGTAPTNPGLLDWLAGEFMKPSTEDWRLEIGDSQKQTLTPNSQLPTAWSVKHLHRLIVHSATYRQSSRARPELTTIDPTNRLLARQNRLRLDAEVVRDVSLSASGLLRPKIGGPSVFPPIPEGVMSLGQVKREWKVSAGDDRYRRGLYTFFFRATPPPALNVFDAPDAYSTCTRRTRSNTPLQALTLLNDAGFYEFAQALAGRTLHEGPASADGKLEYAFRLCLGRKPSPSEARRLGELLAQQLAAESDERKQLSAWTTVSRVILNLDETITRE